MKAFTERNPKVVGITAVAVMAVCVLAILFLNRSLFTSGYTIDARFTNAAGISKGTQVMVAGVNAGTVTCGRGARQCGRCPAFGRQLGGAPARHHRGRRG